VDPGHHPHEVIGRRLPSIGRLERQLLREAGLGTRPEPWCQSPSAALDRPEELPVTPRAPPRASAVMPRARLCSRSQMPPGVGFAALAKDTAAGLGQPEKL
jgi:hypothetical protein